MNSRPYGTYKIGPCLKKVRIFENLSLGLDKPCLHFETQCKFITAHSHTIFSQANSICILFSSQSTLLQSNHFFPPNFQQPGVSSYPVGWGEQLRSPPSTAFLLPCTPHSPLYAFPWWRTVSEKGHQTRWARQASSCCPCLGCSCFCWSSCYSSSQHFCYRLLLPVGQHKGEMKIVKTDLKMTLG